jgi:hypothetical protein
MVAAVMDAGISIMMIDGPLEGCLVHFRRRELVPWLWFSKPLAVEDGVPQVHVYALTGCVVADAIVAGRSQLEPAMTHVVSIEPGKMLELAVGTSKAGQGGFLMSKKGGGRG